MEDGARHCWALDAGASCLEVTHEADHGALVIVHFDEGVDEEEMDKEEDHHHIADHHQTLVHHSAKTTATTTICLEKTTPVVAIARRVWMSLLLPPLLVWLVLAAIPWLVSLIEIHPGETEMNGITEQK